MATTVVPARSPKGDPKPRIQRDLEKHHFGQKKRPEGWIINHLGVFSQRPRDALKPDLTGWIQDTNGGNIPNSATVR